MSVTGSRLAKLRNIGKGVITKRSFHLHFGSIVAPIAEQLELQGIRFSRTDVQSFQDDADDLVRLRLRSVITDGDARRAERRLIKLITIKLEAYAAQNPKKH